MSISKPKRMSVELRLHKECEGLADTGSSTHIFNSTRNLFDIRHFVEGVSVEGVGGKRVAEAAGKHPHLGSGLVLPDYGGPTLISVGQLWRTHDLCIPKWGMFLFVPRKGDGPCYAAKLGADNLFYLFRVRDKSHLAFVARAGLSESKRETIWMLHEILAHASAGAICSSLDSGEYYALGITSEDVRKAGLERCIGCVYGKMHAGHPGDHHVPEAKQIGEDQHCDLVFLRHKSQKEPIIYFVAVDGVTGYVWYQRLESKEAKEVLKAIVGLVQFHRAYMAKRKEPQVHIRLHSDMDSTIAKLARKGDLAALGVEHRHVAAEVHERKVERTVRTIRDKSRTVTVSLKFPLPAELLPDLVEDVITSMNQTGNKASGGPTPLTLVTGEKVDGSHFQVPFGCVGIFHVPNNDSSMEARGEFGFVIGRCIGSRALKAFVPRRRDDGTLVGRRVWRDKIHPLRWPFPDDVNRLLVELASNDPIQSLSGESFLLKETPSHQTITPLSLVEGLQIQGVVSPTSDITHNGPALPIVPQSVSSPADSQEGQPPAAIATALPTGAELQHPNPRARVAGPDGSPGSKRSRLETIKPVGLEGSPGTVSSQDVKAGTTSESSVLSNRGDDSVSVVSSGGAPSLVPSAEGVESEGSANQGLAAETLSPRDAVDTSSTSHAPTGRAGPAPGSPATKKARHSEGSASRVGQQALGRPLKRKSATKVKDFAVFNKRGHYWVRPASKRGEVWVAISAPNAADGTLTGMRRDAVVAEAGNMVKYRVFGAVDLKDLTPKQIARAIPTMMLVQNKVGPDGVLIKIKARLVIKGFRERYLALTNRTDSPTISDEIVMITLNIATSRNLDIDIFDIGAAFLEAEMGDRKVLAHIDKELADTLVLMSPELKSGRLPDGSLIVLLRRALYGLKDAPRKWYLTLRTFLLEIGFVAAKHDECLFIRVTEEGLHYVLVHVDDMLSTGPKSSMAYLRESLKRRFQSVTEKLNPSEFNYLGMTVKRDRERRLMYLTQTKYINELVEDLQLGPSEVAKSPFKSRRHSEDADLLEEEMKSRFLALTMRMNYVVKTRPDIRFAVGRLTTRTANPTVEDWEDLVQAVKYLQKTRDLPTVIRASSLQLHGAADASFASEEGRKSRTGYLFWLGKRENGPLVTSSKKQTLVTTSTAEAELVALCAAGKQAVWIRAVLEEMGIKQLGPCVIDQDNSACMTLAQRGHHGKLSRSIDISYFWISEQLEKGLLELRKIETGRMIADGLTKAMDAKHFVDWRDRLLNLRAVLRA